MINFKEEYRILTRLYKADQKVIEIPDSNIEIHNEEYVSTFPAEYRTNGVVEGNLYYYELTQGEVSENTRFIYPIMVPKGHDKFSSGIIFFHGLNERSWDKYFVWAKYLAERTDRPVIMFPIAYHINRSPKKWSDPRSMIEVAASRSSEEQSATFANAALSTRLEKNPEKFLISGIQSYYDTIDLVTKIKLGNDPLFEKGAHVDIFSYSIGAFLSEVLLLNNSSDILRDSRLFMFCGGTTFDSMNGISKYIMDESAFRSVMTLNSTKKLKQIAANFINTPKRFIYNWNGIGLMMSAKERRKTRERMLAKCAQNIYAVALEHDTVMPPKMIVRTLKGRRGDLGTRVEIIDFPYTYSHEVPFPINDDKIQPLVNRCFTVVFDNAANFFLMGDVVRERAEAMRAEKAEKVEREKAEKAERTAKARAEKAEREKSKADRSVRATRREQRSEERRQRRELHIEADTEKQMEREKQQVDKQMRRDARRNERNKQRRLKAELRATKRADNNARAAIRDAERRTRRAEKARAKADAAIAKVVAPETDPKAARKAEREAAKSGKAARREEKRAAKCQGCDGQKCRKCDKPNAAL